MPETSTALAVAGGGGALSMFEALRPKNLDEAIRIVEMLHGAVTLPGELRDKPSLFLLVLQAQDLGLSVAQAIRGLHIVKGKPILSADLMMALCLGRPDACVYFRCIESTDKRATFETLRKGADMPRRSSFSMEDAERAKLLDKGSERGRADDNNWHKYPREMLQHRAKARLAREVYPDLLFGVYAKEEIADGAAPDPNVIELHETSPGQYTAPAAVASKEESTPTADVSKAIQEAKTIADLEALIPVMSKLPEDDKPALRIQYRSAKELLLRIAEAPEVMGGVRAETERDDVPIK